MFPPAALRSWHALHTGSSTSLAVHVPLCRWLPPPPRLGFHLLLTTVSGDRTFTPAIQMAGARGRRTRQGPRPAPPGLRRLVRVLRATATRAARAVARRFGPRRREVRSASLPESTDELR